MDCGGGGGGGGGDGGWWDRMYEYDMRSMYKVDRDSFTDPPM